MDSPSNSFEDCDSLMFIVDLISNDDSIVEFEGSNIVVKEKTLGKLLVGGTLIGIHKKDNPITVLGCPITILIFWHLLLLKYPEYKNVFDCHFSERLFGLLIENNFISVTCDEIKFLETEQIFNKMNDNACFHCGKRIYSKDKTMQCKCHFAVSERIFHYIIAGVLKNKWNGDCDEGSSVFKLGFIDVIVEFKTNSHLKIDQFGHNSYHSCVRASFRRFLNLILPDDDYNITI